MKTALHGYHLAAEGIDVACHPGDIGVFLERAVQLIGMTKIATPVVYEAYGVGFQLIAESHISIHVRGLVAQAHVFSCKPFKGQPIIDLLQEIFSGTWKALYFVRSVRDSSSERTRQFASPHPATRPTR